MKYILLGMLSLMTGCYQVINSNDMETAAVLCGGAVKIKEISAHAIGTEFVECTNRRVHNLEEIKTLPKDATN